MVLGRFLTLIIVFGSQCYANSAKPNAAVDLQFSNDISLKINKLDINAAKQIANLKSQVLKRNVSLNYATKTLDIIKKRDLYREFIPWNTSIINILSQKNKRAHFKTCKYAQSELISFCLEKFLRKYKRHDLSSVFENETIFILSNVSSKALSTFLKNAKAKEKITKYFIKEFSNDPKLINRVIVRNLHHSRELTNLIQQTKLFESSYVFKKIIRSKVNSIYSKLDKEQDYEDELNEVLTYTKNINQNINTQIIFKTLFVMGKTLNQKKKYKSARHVFGSLMNLNLGSRSSLYFESLWSYILEEDFENAFDHFIKNETVLSELKSFEDNKINFWLAHIYSKNDIDDKAKTIYEEIIYNSPMSYYSIMSAKKLSQKSETDFTKTYLLNLKNKDLKTNPVITYHKSEQEKLLRIKIWDKIRARRLLRIEKNSYLKAGFTNPYLKISKLFYEDGNYLEGFKSIYRGINLNVETLNPLSLTYLYPTQYLKRLKKTATDIDPIIALSLIRQESAFNKNARSHVGARGLMQIMPNTGRRFHRKLRTHQLYNPKLNIKIGTTYLKNLLKRYDDNLVYTLAAYNAGESRVKRWKKELFNDDSILENIEKIPFLETRKYVKLIFRNIFFYKLLNEDKKASRKLASNDQNYLYDVYLGF